MTYGRRLPRHRYRLGLLAAFAIASAPGAALADGADSAAADALFNAAKKLSDAGKYAEACPKFEASLKLDHTLGTLLNLADCHEHIGALAQAWAEWGEAAELADRAGDDRAGFAKQHRAALTPRLPKLEVKVTHPKEGLSVLRDGTTIAEGAYGVPLPIDPGKHVIAVKRGKQTLSEKTVEATEGKTVTVALDLTAIDAGTPAETESDKDADTGPEPTYRYNTRRNIAFVLGATGLAALVGAGVIEALAIASKPAEGECPNNFCTPNAYEKGQQAQKLATVGQWVGLAGLVAIGTGAALYVSIPTGTKMARVSPWIGPDAGGIAVGGAL